MALLCIKLSPIGVVLFDVCVVVVVTVFLGVGIDVGVADVIFWDCQYRFGQDS